MIRLVFIDVDGTLVGTDGSVHPAVWTAARRARQAGIRLALCSGRPGFGLAREYAARLDPDGWHCFQNGASVVHLASGLSRSARFDPESVAMLVDRARRSGRLLELYADEDYVFEGPPERAHAHAALLGVPYAERPFEALEGAVVRAQWLLPPDELPIVLTEPHPGLELSPSTSPMMPDTRFVNVTPAGVDKGSAVRAVAAACEIPLERVMFVGDGLNDLAAMRIVSCPVAMANSDAEVLALARHAVGHVDDGGLAEAIELAIAARAAAA
jgi:Cof subfamily protein (haloacid dehalogenase superfamily)